jgi:hypothetical protein
MSEPIIAQLVPPNAAEAAKLSPFGWREVVTITVSVAVADLTIYRGHGYTGLGFFFLAYPVLLILGRLDWRPNNTAWVIAALLLALTIRLCWYGSNLGVCCGFGLTFAFATTLDRKVPYLHTVFATATQSTVNGLRNLWGNSLLIQQSIPQLSARASLSVVLPLIALFAFGGLFVLANPDAVSFFGKRLGEFFHRLSEWFVQTALRPTELLFWFLIACVTAGLLRPILQLAQLLGGEQRSFAQPSGPSQGQRQGAESKAGSGTTTTQDVSLYAAFRNTLVSVIALFAGYLLYEFSSLWFRTFPEGFYYAGYAHQGAAWLTIALALATLTLSLVFSGTVLSDSRLPKLRRLAWIWSAQNLILSLAVYNRLYIYIDFNGMTKMRIVGLFGTSLVVVGFLLMVWKIARGRDFPWLVQRQLWAFAMAVYLFSLTPVDGLAARFNVRRVQQGNLAACMQLGVHKLDLEGTMALLPLLDSPNKPIRDGAAARLAGQAELLERQEKRRAQLGWTATQAAGPRALKRLRDTEPKWARFKDGHKRGTAIEEFREFAYQWY